MASSTAHIEYVGFAVKGAGREYTLRVRDAAGSQRDFIMTISNDAFLGHRVRYQDAPDVCFRLLQRQLLAGEDGDVTPRMSVTEANLEEYRAAQAPKAPHRGPKPPPVAR